MDPTLKTTIDGMLSTFAHLPVSDPGVAAEIEQYKADMYALGERCPDAMTFMTELQTSGLMERQTELITKASMASQASAQAQPASDAPQSPGQLPTVREFLAQYEPSYQAARAHGFQFTAVKAYEQMFAIADRTDDLMTMNLILEEEGHLRAMTAAALYDINKLNYDTTDPNNYGVRESFQRLMELASSYRTDEELYYQTDVITLQNQQAQYQHNYWIVVSALLSEKCVGYDLAKKNARTDVSVFGGAFIAARDAIRNTYAAIQNIFGLDFDAIVANPVLKHWMLIPQNLDSTGRITKCLDIRNLDYMREVIFEEALSSLTDAECLLRNPTHPFYPSLNTSHDPEQRAADEAIQKAGKERLKDKYYHDYEKKVTTPDLSGYGV